MQVISDSIDECLIYSFDCIDLLHLNNNGSHSIDDLVFILRQPQIRDLTCVQQIIDVLDECLRNNLSICH